MKQEIHAIRTTVRLMVTIAFLLAVAPAGYCQHISIASNGYTYQQNFNTLTASGDWNNGSTLNGWYAASQELDEYEAFSTSAGGSDTHGFYSFGSVNSVNGSGDRALGSINQDASGDIAYGVLFKNTSGVTINSVSISLRAEQWRRVNTNKKGYQRIKVAYRVNNSINTNTAGLFSNSFVDIQEAYLITLDTTKVSSSMDGNANGNFATISLQIPVVIPNNSKFFLRFLDENAYHVDAALALDDLSVQFSSTALDRINVTSGYNFSAYLDQAVLTDIPGDNPQNIYTIPDGANMTDWTDILLDFFAGNISGELGTYGYQWVQFTNSASGQTYNVLRKKNNSSYYWGTYASRVNPANEVLTIQAPHPLKDAGTEKQATSVFEVTGAAVLMIAGTDRCNSTFFTSCTGTTDICNVNDQKFRRSDVAHDIESIFHLATTVLAGVDPNMKFVQLHGFGQSGSDPEFIVSAGLLNHTFKSGIDYPALFEVAVANSGLPEKDVKIPHLDDYSQLAALDNVQGRFLNEYNADSICAGASDPSFVTNRFLHIEQYKVVRDNPIHYDDMASIINSVVNEENESNSYISISNPNGSYQQDFNGLAIPTGTSLWVNDYTLNAWHAVRSSATPLVEYRIGTGSSTSHGIYSFGSAENSDRSLGSLNQDESGHFAYGVLFRNTSGQTIRSVNLTYRAEQWRVSTNASQQRIKLSYAISPSIKPTAAWMLNNANFTNHVAGDLITLLTGAGSSQAVNGNSIGNYTNINVDIPLSLPDGEELFIRFYDDNATGIDHAMALDDFQITFSANDLMPVQLAYFDLERTSPYQLTATWKTLYEVNCSHFILENAGDELEWATLGQVAGAGTTMEARNYTWTHRPIQGKNYYRLSQVDVDGKTKVLGIKYMAIDPTHESLNTTMYPNPAGDEFTIQSDSHITEATLRIWDKSMGQMLGEKTFNAFGSSQTMDVKSLPGGHYVVELRTRTGRQIMSLVIAR